MYLFILFFYISNGLYNVISTDCRLTIQGPGSEEAAVRALSAFPGGFTIGGGTL